MVGAMHYLNHIRQGCLPARFATVEGQALVSRDSRNFASPDMISRNGCSSRRAIPPTALACRALCIYHRALPCFQCRQSADLGSGRNLVMK